MAIDLFDYKNASIPSDTYHLLSNSQWTHQKVDNFALKFFRLQQFVKEGEKDKIALFQFIKGRREQPNEQLSYLNPTGNHFGNVNFAKISEQVVSAAKASFLQIGEPPTFELKSRLALGLGTASVFETGITLHHIYGFPYIPSSGIKGAVRSWMIANLFGNPKKQGFPEQEKNFPLHNAEARALQDKDFCRIFGCPGMVESIIFENNEPVFKNREKKVYKTAPIQVALRKTGEPQKGQEHQGNVIFLDAFPVSAPLMKEDIMNPHYPDYYTGDSAPTDFQSPRPIPFMTVEKGSKFKFLLACNENLISETIDPGKSLLEITQFWLKKTLEEHGLGAKTAVGYGYFKETS